MIWQNLSQVPIMLGNGHWSNSTHHPLATQLCPANGPLSQEVIKSDFGLLGAFVNKSFGSDLEIMGVIPLQRSTLELVPNEMGFVCTRKFHIIMIVIT
jgi:hypothetical protein